MKKMITCLVLALLLAVPAALAAQVRLADGADVRTGPGAEYDEAYSPPASAWAEAVATVEDGSGRTWLHVEYSDAYGERYRAYVRARGVSSYGGLPQERYRGADAVVARDTYPYCGPGRGYASTGMILAGGTNVSLIDRENGFALIEYRDGNSLARDYVPEADVMDAREYEQTYGRDPGDGGHVPYVPFDDDQFVPFDDGGYVPYVPFDGDEPEDGESEGVGGRYYVGVQGSFKASQSPRLIYVERVYESSHLENMYGDYSCDRAFDADPGTDWVEGSYGYDLYDYVGCVWRLRDYDRLGAYGLTIRGGMQYKGQTSWARNDRPKDITVTINGYRYRFTLRDTMEEQTLYFDRYLIPPADGRFDLMVRIDSVYACNYGASEGYDVAINDIDLLLTDE